MNGASSIGCVTNVTSCQHNHFNEEEECYVANNWRIVLDTNNNNS